MKYTTIVIAALLGYAQAVTVRDDSLENEDGPEARRVVRKEEKKPFNKFDFSDSSDSDEDWPVNNGGFDMGRGNAAKGNGDFNGKGKIISGEAGANSNQGQNVRILPDTETVTSGSSSCWAKNAAKSDDTLQRHTTKDFAIKGKIVVKEDTVGATWSSSQGESDGSATKSGTQGVKVLDSSYQGQLGELTSSSCPQGPVSDFH